jgi:hypothetical protein
LHQLNFHFGLWWNYWVPNGAARCMVGFNALWGGKYHFIEVGNNSPNWGDGWPNDLELIHYQNVWQYGDTMDYVYLNGSSPLIKLPLLPNQPAAVAYDIKPLPIYKLLVERGILPAPPDWNNVEVISVGLATELNNFSIDKSGIVDLWFTDWRIDSL